MFIDNARGIAVAWSSPRMTRWLLWVQLLCLPGTSEKCNFDEIQSSVRVVHPVPDQLSSENMTFSIAQARAQFRHIIKNVPLLSFPVSSASQFAYPFLTKVQERISRQVTFSAKLQEQNDFSALLPIRIKTWIPQEAFVLSQAQKQHLELAVSEAVSILSNILSVNRIPGHLLLNRDINKFCKFIWRNASVANYNKCGRANDNYRTEMCLDVIIPDDHLRGCVVHPHPTSKSVILLRSEGVGLPDTDFVLYLHTQSTEKCNTEPNVLAYAAHCQTDHSGRPLAGVIVFCRDKLGEDVYNHGRTVQTLIHELFHVLGFSKDLFDMWKDCSYASKIGEDCLSRGQVTNIDETGQVRIYTRAVIQALQSHLGSFDAELGAPLENLGARGPSSHWEARVLQGSIMTALLDKPELVRIDPLTLAALQDTGWYQVNYTAAQKLEWGEGQGSQFGSLATCHDKSSTFFCTGRGEFVIPSILNSGLGCHYLHLHKGECQSDQYLEGCRIYKPLINASECWKEGNGGKSQVEEWSGEIYSFESRCFFSNLTRESSPLSTSSSVVGHCYRHRCTGLNRYQIKVSGSEWLDCPAGSSVQVPGYRGSIFCPDKRLCLHSRLAFPPNQEPSPVVTSLGFYSTERPPGDVTSDPNLALSSAVSTMDSAKGAALNKSPAVVAVAALGLLALLLTALLLAYRRCCSFRLRVQAVTDTPLV